jgi:hypothetical protein
MRRSVFLLLSLSACSAAPQHYAEACHAPLKHWLTPKDGIGELLDVNLVQLGKDGSIRWVRDPVSVEQLEQYLHRSGDLPTSPQILLHVDPAADCAAVRALRARMDRTPICATQHRCGEGTGWRRWPGAKPIV